eukprot:scaffold2495_cov101-Isochrysis_galbana.AAC.1
MYAPEIFAIPAEDLREDKKSSQYLPSCQLGLPAIERRTGTAPELRNQYMSNEWASASKSRRPVKSFTRANKYLGPQAHRRPHPQYLILIKWKQGYNYNYIQP